ncbi:Uncharacterized protein Adt_20727 [Abeliophyllum distichum]|uniref:Uncharacterized protein n=1 Tax=Abeliophyllum distichum TaxID=126358 RepID=A0ABD1SXI1_9LAMI
MSCFANKVRRPNERGKEEIRDRGSEVKTKLEKMFKDWEDQKEINHGRGRSDPITFTPTDATRVHFLHNGALVVQTVVAKNSLGRMLVDDRNSVNIIYGATYDKMGIEALMIPAMDPIYGITGDFIVPKGTIILITEMEEAPTIVRTPMEYLVVDKSSSYHGVLGRPVLIDLGAMIHTKFLCMKISTDWKIAMVRSNQSKSRTCYTNAMWKFVDREVNAIDVEMKEAPLDLERLDDRLKVKDEQMKK